MARVDCTVFVFGPTFQGRTIGPFLVPPYRPTGQPRIRPTGIRQYAVALTKPEGTKVLRTYGDLIPYKTAFAAGAFDLLVIIGRPGLSKSTTFRKFLAGDTCWITGTISAFRAYGKLYEFRNQLAVFDDVDISPPGIVHLLRELCNNEAVTTVTWETDAARLRQMGIPTQFETETKVCLMVNDWGTFNARLESLEDRAVIISFESTAHEVHDQVAREGWFHDKDIWDFIGRHLNLITKPTMRHYVKARQHKRAGMDWQGYLLNLWLEDESFIQVARLLDDPTLSSMRAKARAYEERGFGARATFFRKAKALRQS